MKLRENIILSIFIIPSFFFFTNGLFVVFFYNFTGFINILFWYFFWYSCNLFFQTCLSMLNDSIWSTSSLLISMSKPSKNYTSLFKHVTTYPFSPLNSSSFTRYPRKELFCTIFLLGIYLEILSILICAGNIFNIFFQMQVSH